MLKLIKSQAEKIYKKLKTKRVKPLVSHNHDYKLMRRVHNKKMPRLGQLSRLSHVLSSNERLALRLSIVVFLIGFVWVGSDFVGKHRLQVPAVGGRHVEAVVGSPQFINPIFATTNDVDMDISRLVFSGLLHLDEKNRLVKDLAANYEVSEDKKVYTFELREDVLWHDGEPFTARDILFTFEAIQNNVVGSPLSVSFQGVTISALDDYTVRFELQEPYSAFLASLTVGILPEHVWFNVLPEQMRLAQVNIQPVGTGPFMFSKLSKDETGHIYNYELMRFDRFYREPPFLEEFVFQFFPEYENDTGAVQALRSQKVTALSFVPKHLHDRVKRKHIVLHTLQLPQYSALFFNANNNPILKDKDLRLALAEAVDKDRILREALQGEGQIIRGPILPGFPGYDPEVEKIKFSLDSANKLLDEDWDRISAEDYRQARFAELTKEWEEANPVVTSTEELSVEEEGEPDPSAPSSDDEVSQDLSTTTPRQQAEIEINIRLDEELSAAQTFYRQDDDDNILQINLVTVDTDEYKYTAELIAGFWQEIGVKTNITLVSAKEILRDVLKTRKYDILLYGVIVGGDPDQYAFWHSSQVDYPGLNLSRYVNRNVDALLVKIRETSDEAELAELYKKFQDLILAERPAIFLYMPTYTYATSDEVRGINVSRISHPSDRFADVTTWFMKTKGDWKW